MIGIEGRKIIFKREDTVIISELNFTANSGEVLWIKGENGVGKTTLLKIIAGLIKTFSGGLILTYSDKRVPSLNNHITYIGEKLACDEELSVLENLRFWARFKDRIELLEATISFFGFDSILNVKVGNLSSGWKKKVSLSRLLLFNSKVWILDEPFVHLDAESIALLSSLIEERVLQRGLIILVSHGDVQIKSNLKYLALPERIHHEKNETHHNFV